MSAVYLIARKNSLDECTNSCFRRQSIGEANPYVFEFFVQDPTKLRQYSQEWDDVSYACRSEVEDRILLLGTLASRTLYVILLCTLKKAMVYILFTCMHVYFLWSL